MVRFGRLTEHEKDACEYRQAACKYHSVGCDWKGYARDARKHSKQCDVKGFSMKEILRGVSRRNEEAERLRAAEKLTNKAHINVCNYLSKRCRDVAVRDVVIQYDPITKERCANTFTACGLAWQLFLDPVTFVAANSGLTAATGGIGGTGGTGATATAASTSQPSPTLSPSSPSVAFPSPTSPLSSPPTTSTKQDAVLSMHINVISPITRRTVIIFILLPGPNLDVELPPTITKVTYTKHATESELFRLRADDAKVKEVYAMDAINMRLIVIDSSRGRMKRTFGGDADDDSPSEASEEEDDGDRHRRHSGGGGGSGAGRGSQLLDQRLPFDFDEDWDEDDEVDDDELDAELMDGEMDDDDDEDDEDEEDGMDGADDLMNDSLSSGEMSDYQLHRMHRHEHLH